MVVFDEPTDLIMVRAKSNSTWDDCAFALISMSVIKSYNISNYLNLIKYASWHDRFSNIRFDVDGVQFFSQVDFPMSDLYLDEILSEGKEWVYVEIEDNEFEKFRVPVNRLSFYEMVCSKHEIYFAADGEHTGDRFWTMRMPLDILGTRGIIL